MNDRVSLRLAIRGQVQGVGFRYAMHQEARRLGLSGWVRNRRDGSVEAVVQGPAVAVEAIQRWAMNGPPAARVTGVEATPASDEPLTAFELRPTA